MGSIVGSVVGGIFGKDSGDEAADTASQGFNYMKSNENIQSAQEGGLEAQKYVEQLLGLRGGDAADKAFEGFRDSTGYQFAFEEGVKAIETSGAAAGLLNSGSTVKGLTKYGQDLATQTFNDFFGKLSGVKDAGLESAYAVGGQGTASGAASAGYQYQGAQDTAAGIGGLISGVTSIFGF